MGFFPPFTALFPAFAENVQWQLTPAGQKTDAYSEPPATGSSQIPCNVTQKTTAPATAKFQAAPCSAAAIFSVLVKSR
jgi:hypothetical protein